MAVPNYVEGAKRVLYIIVSTIYNFLVTPLRIIGALPWYIKILISIPIVIFAIFILYKLYKSIRNKDHMFIRV